MKVEINIVSQFPFCRPPTLSVAVVVVHLVNILSSRVVFTFRGSFVKLFGI